MATRTKNHKCIVNAAEADQFVFFLLHVVNFQASSKLCATAWKSRCCRILWALFVMRWWH